MSDHSRLEELAELYMTGGLDSEDRVMLEEHVASGCEQCQATLLESLKLAGRLLDATTPVAPPPRVKQQLMQQVAQAATDVPEIGSATAFPRAWLALAAALSAVAIGLGLYALSLSRQTDSLRLALEAQDSSRQAAVQRAEELESRTAALESRVSALTGPNAQPVALTGQEGTANARARAFLDRENGRLLLYVYDLAPLPPGQTYQLWVIVEGTPVSAGTFDVTPDGTASYDAAPIATLGPEQSVAIAVTAEPAGGVPQPTGPLVLVES